MTPLNLGKIIRAARQARRLRQEELAAAAGVGVRFLGELEGGKPTAQIGKALNVLAALGCDVSVTPPAEPPSNRKRKP